MKTKGNMIIEKNFISLEVFLCFFHLGVTVRDYTEEQMDEVT